MCNSSKICTNEIGIHVKQNSLKGIWKGRKEIFLEVNTSGVRKRD